MVIRDEIAKGVTPTDLSKLYEVSLANIRAIRTGRSWSHVGGPRTLSDGRTAWKGRVRWSKLTPQQVNQIRAEIAAGRPQRAIAKSFSIHQTQVSNIARGRQWKLS